MYDSKVVSDSGLVSFNSLPLYKYVSDTSTVYAMNSKIHTYNEEFLHIFEHLEEEWRAGMEYGIKTNVRRKLFPKMYLYLCGLTERKYASGMQHGTIVNRPCVRCIFLECKCWLSIHPNNDRHHHCNRIIGEIK